MECVRKDCVEQGAPTYHWLSVSFEVRHTRSSWYPKKIIEFLSIQLILL